MVRCLGSVFALCVCTNSISIRSLDPTIIPMIVAHLEASNLALKEDFSTEDRKVYMEYTNGWVAHYVGIDGYFKVWASISLQSCN